MGRDCRTRLARPNLQARNGDRDFYLSFPISADDEQDWQPYPVDPYSYYMSILLLCCTYTHTYIVCTVLHVPNIVLCTTRAVFLTIRSWRFCYCPLVCSKFLRGVYMPGVVRIIIPLFKRSCPRRCPFRKGASRQPVIFAYMVHPPSCVLYNSVYVTEASRSFPDCQPPRGIQPGWFAFCNCSSWLGLSRSRPSDDCRENASSPPPPPSHIIPPPSRGQGQTSRPLVFSRPYRCGGR